MPTNIPNTRLQIILSTLSSKCFHDGAFS